MVTRKRKSRKAKRTKKPAKSRARQRKTSRSRWRGALWRLFGGSCLVALLAIVALAVYLDITVRNRFESRDWAVPAHIHARPMEIYPGQTLSREKLRRELLGLGYRATESLAGPGSFRLLDDGLELQTRDTVFWDEQQPGMRLRIAFDGGRVSTVTDLKSGDERVLTRLEPRLLGSISTATHEDRDLITLGQAPELFIKTLLVIEDRSFFHHHGIDIRGLARATLANIRARRFVQGGSTITQQLIKNLYLNSERTLKRKFTEIFMALLLELHYDKGEILEAYLNEVFLGQSGNRAIHGFGLASRFYFGRPLAELALDEIALLVGMIRGPSYYDPRRNPERATERRNVVLDELVNRNVIDAAQARKLKVKPIRVKERQHAVAGSFPAFQDLVHRSLRSDYRPQDLNAEGLAIYTSVDPQMQSAAQRALQERLDKLEAARGLEPNSLQGAVVLIRADNGEVLALVGDRRQGYAGFNRALDARRPVGSLIKPVIYLAALERSADFSLATLLDDSPLDYVDSADNRWQPQNFDKTHHGEVPLLTALAKSYNTSTARLGLAVGVDSVIDTLRRLGVRGDLNSYPSLFLGAMNLSPYEVTQLYQSFANNGFSVPLRGILAVLSRDHLPIARYPLAVAQVIDPAPAYLLDFALHEVVANGTASGLNARIDPALSMAGKTGTTDEFRDSWYAGYVGEYLAVVWIGRDDNRPTGLTGASGAMQVWADLMSQLALTPRSQPVPAGIMFATVEPASGLLADAGCDELKELPFAVTDLPTRAAPCANSPPSVGVSPRDAGAPDEARKPSRFGNWLNELFGDGGRATGKPRQQEPNR